MNGASKGLMLWARRGIGIVLALSTVAYCVVVTMEGGLIANPKRPEKPEDLDKMLERYEIQQQDAGALFKQAIKPPRHYAKAIQKMFAKNILLLVYRIELHRSWASGAVELPEGYSRDLNTFRTVDFAQIPTEYKVWLASVVPKTVYFHSAQMYESLGGSAEPPEAVYRGFLSQLVALQWKVEAVMYDPLGNEGIISARRGEVPRQWFITIGVLGRKVFPDSPTTVFWRMDRLGSDDEDAYKFIEILSYHETYGYWE